MKILLVEDRLPKRDAIIEVINGAVPGADIRLSNSYNSAMSALMAEEFELVILDILIPLRSEDGSPMKEHGIAIVREILDGEEVKVPNHLLCLSEYQEVFEGCEGLATCIVNMVHYEDGGSDWADELRAKIIYAKRRIDLSGVIPTDYSVDVGVVCSYPPVELEAVTSLEKYLGAEFNRCDQLHYHRAEWTGVERSIDVVACAAPAMGMAAACVTACKLITRWRPRYLVMTGITAGTDDELDYGDILVAETCYDYGSGKIVDVEKDLKFLPNPQQITIDRGLLALLQRWEAKQISMETIGRSWSRKADIIPKMKIGVLATGAAVVQSADFVKSVQDHARKVIGLEMEAYGIFQAANLSSHPKPKVLVVKSVSDFAITGKDDSAHSLAAFTSAAFIQRFFTDEPNLDF